MCVEDYAKPIREAPGIRGSAGPDAGQPDCTQRRLEVVKTNLCAPPPPLLLDLSESPRLRYELLPDAMRDELLANRAQRREPTLVDKCAEWLVALLQETGEPVRPCDVVSLAQDVGFSRMTVYRAREKLGDEIVNVANGLRDPNRRWALGAG